MTHKVKFTHSVKSRAHRQGESARREVTAMRAASIIDYIPEGKENAITREQLTILTGFPDRAVRQAIAHARRETPILNNQDGTGYYRPTQAEKPLVERFIRQEECRAKSIFYSLKAARDFLKGW